MPLVAMQKVVPKLCFGIEHDHYYFYIQVYLPVQASGMLGKVFHGSLNFYAIKALFINLVQSGKCHVGTSNILIYKTLLLMSE